MNWKIKAFMQNCIASFPETLSRKMYFQMQRYLGRAKKTSIPGSIFFLIVLECCKK
jgi:hypothetical protein